jgi:hypothetical protein
MLSLVAIPPRFIQPPPAPSPSVNFIVIMKDSAYITQQIARMAYVAGEVCGIQGLSERLAAASEKVVLAPH